MNKRNIGLLLLFTFCFVFAGQAQSTSSLKINEVMVSNHSNYINNYGEHGAWIEIWNSSYASVNIEGCYLSNDKNNPTKYSIPKGDVATVIGPRQYLIFWADNMPGKGTFHLNFELDPQRENYIALYDTNGKTLLSEVKVPANIKPDHSYARVIDGADKWEIRGEETNKHVTPSSTNKLSQTNEKIENFKQHDSLGIGMAIIAMTVVFTGLIVLYFSFTLTGKIAVKMGKRNDMKNNEKGVAATPNQTVSTTSPSSGTNEDIVAITMALHEHLGGVHDKEDMVLTFKEVGPSQSPWSLKIFGLRKR